MTISQLLYGCCVLLTGLLAGLFYGYQCSVNNGLGALGDKEYLLGFQSINKSILNPVFFLSFLGSLVSLIFATFLSYHNGDNHLSIHLLLATLIYAIGVFGITIAFNVPLNELLAGFDIHSATGKQLGEMREKFEKPWNTWHLFRTGASVVTFLLLLLPLIKRI